MKPYYERRGVAIYHADARDVLPSLPHGRDGQSFVQLGRAIAAFVERAERPVRA